MPRQLRFKVRVALAACAALSLFCALALLLPASATPTALAQSGPSHFIRQLPVTTKDVVYSRVTGRLYASVPSRFGPTGNSIATIDPATGAVESYTFIGSEPGKLALSADGRTLYVGLDGAAAVRRFDVVTQTAGEQFPLGEDTFNGPFFVKDMAVAPGNPDLVAVSRRNVTSSAEFEGVAVYDGGVRRPLATRSHTGSDYIAFSDSPSTLYGVRDFGAIEKLGVTGAGVTLLKETLTNTSGGDFRLEGGNIYLPQGSVYNAESGTLLGRYTFPSASFAAVEPEPSLGRVYFLTGESAFYDSDTRPLTLHAYNQTTFLPLGTLQIPSVVGRVSRLVRWGANGLAFGTTGGQLFIIQTSFVPSDQPVPTPTPTPSATPTPTPSPSPTPTEVREVTVSANDIIFDRVTQTAFASVPASAGVAGNSITPFDPFSGAVGQPVFVGSEPGKLAISDNGQYVYVGLDGAKAVRRFDVATRTAGLQFTLDDAQQGQHFARDLEVAPGQPQTVAVVRGTGGSSDDVAIYDDGVQRPNTTGIFHDIDVIEYSASPFILYGHNNSNSEGGFRKMALPPCGPSVLSTKGSLLWGLEFRVENGLAYSDSGRVADPEAGTLVGMFPVRDGITDSMYTAGSVVDTEAGRIYFFLHEPIHSGTAPLPMLIRAYDLHTFVHLGTMTVPQISGFPTSFFRWGADGFAVRTTSNKVYLIRTDLVPTATQPVTPAPVPTPPSYTLRGQVASFNGPPAPTVTLNLSGPLTGTTTTAADGSFAFTRLPFCADFTVTPQPIENYTISPASVTITAANQNFPNRATAFFNVTAKAFSFTQTATSVGEGAGSVTVVVTRTGDLQTPATVFYQTSDDTASERSDYTAAVGTLTFGPNESSKQIKLYITDDVRSEPDETFNISLSNPTGGMLGTVTTQTVTISDNDAANGTTNPADDPSFFVRQHYLDFLGREPDAAGLQFWRNEIESCGADQQCREVKRVNVSAAFFLSIEFQETGFFAYRVFKAAYGDATSPGVAGTVPVIGLRDFLADGQRIGRGVVVNVGNWQQQLEANKNAYAQEFVQRQRFTDIYGALGPAAFVDKLNANAGGVLSAAERQGLIDELTADNSVAKRAAALRTVAEDADLRAAELNRAFVLMQYFGYLRRNPNNTPDADFRGWKFWLDKLNEFNGNYVQAEMVKAFISSDEYRQRFGQ